MFFIRNLKKNHSQRNIVRNNKMIEEYNIEKEERWHLAAPGCGRAALRRTYKVSLRRGQDKFAGWFHHHAGNAFGHLFSRINWGDVSRIVIKLCYLRQKAAATIKTFLLRRGQYKLVGWFHHHAGDASLHLVGG